MKVDGTTVATFTGQVLRVDRDVEQRAAEVTPGPHDVTGDFNWPTRRHEPQTFAAHVNCPKPTTPPPTPTPTPDADAPDARRPRRRPAPTATPAPPATPPRARPRRGPGEAEKARMRAQEAREVPHHRHAEASLHGLVTFHLKGHGARNVRWFVDTRRAVKTNKSWEWLRRGGRDYASTCGRRSAGACTSGAATPIEAQFTVKNSCGKGSRSGSSGCTSTTTRCRTTRSSRTSADRITPSLRGRPQRRPRCRCRAARSSEPTLGALTLTAPRAAGVRRPACGDEPRGRDSG